MMLFGVVDVVVVDVVVAVVVVVVPVQLCEGDPITSGG